MSSTSSPEQFSWSDLLRAISFFLGSLRSACILWTLAIFSVYFEFLVPPYLIGKIVDFFSRMQPGDALTEFYWSVILLSAISAAASIVRLSCKRALGGIAIQMEYQARVRGFERLMDLSLAWHDQENTGSKVQKIQTGSSALAELLRNLFMNVLPTAAKFIGVLAVFGLLQSTFVLFCLVYLCFFFYLTYYYYGREQQAILQHKRAMEAASGTYIEGTSNILTIKALGATNSIRDRVRSKEGSSKDSLLVIRDLGTSQWRAYQLVNAGGMLIFLLLVGEAVLAKAITVGAVFTYYSYFASLILSAGDFVNVFGQLLQGKVAIGRMMPIFWSSQPSRDGQKDFPRDWKVLSLNNGSFRYQSTGKEFSVQNLNLTINRSEKIGIAGSSGSGKSTLAKLLLGVYRLESGRMLVDDCDYSEIRHDAITDRVSIVLQESELFNFSLKENITLMRQVDPELFARAISIAQLEPVIKSLPDGIETLIGEKGYRLSGGERQRVGIARAICKNPEILVLDEATSSLDTRNEQAIHAALASELSDKTLIIIAHRLSTLEGTDRLYVFDHGSIVESGAFTELMSNESSLFHRLLRSEQS